MSQRLRKVVWRGGGVRRIVLSPSDAALFWMRSLSSEAVGSAGTADTSADSYTLHHYNELKQQWIHLYVDQTLGKSLFGLSVDNSNHYIKIKTDLRNESKALFTGTLGPNTKT